MISLPLKNKRKLSDFLDNGYAELFRFLLLIYSILIYAEVKLYNSN